VPVPIRGGRGAGSGSGGPRRMRGRRRVAPLTRLATRPRLLGKLELVATPALHGALHGALQEGSASRSP
jgi:hypothetical protein